MCGIVTYFGGAGNNLTRILTAMSAIIYRAPDSTGIGFFGDDAASLRVRRSLGSVADLIPVLLDDPAYPNRAAEQLAILAPEPDPDGADGQQRRLMAFEGFALDLLEDLRRGRQALPSFDDLVELDETKAFRMAPGFPGRVACAEALEIRSHRDLREVIRYLIEAYDLSPLVIQILIRRHLAETLSRHQTEGHLEIEPEDILAAFDRLFDQSILGERGLHPQPLEYGRFPGSPLVEKFLWHYLIETRINIPADFDRDGVRCVFRLLDAALLSRLPHDSQLEERLDAVLDDLWPAPGGQPTTGWKSLYQAEKAVNLYGWAAGAALTFLQREECLPELERGASGDAPAADQPAFVPGQTDPISLRYLSLPIISQGRWSIQSSVTVQNAHPFFDGRKQRLIALNGKFDTGLESELRDFLEKVARVPFRSENSSEYVSLLWGHYHQQLMDEKRRSEAIMSQVEAGFESTPIGSQAIDYQLYHRVKSKTAVELDAEAFIEAARQIVRQGGQVAVTGISLVSPRRVYLASHNRPIFIVRRLENDDFMIVSDINAAMGLFPHALIHERTLSLVKLRRERRRALEKMKIAGADKAEIRTSEARFQQKEADLLSVFRVAVYPIVGEEIFAQIVTAIENRRVKRKVLITDFEGNRRPDFESTTTILRPPAIRDDLYRSYYENHLHEIPERLIDILDYYLPEHEELPQFPIREERLRRHFGTKLTTLKRVVLVGVAGSHNMAAAARAFIAGLLPEVEVLVLMPAEIDDPTQFIDTDTDLVILLSWSATTADMVELAKSLETRKAVTIAITEKSFGDMALYAQKSGGVIPILSGEEVTVTGIKSTICMLFCVCLFAIWLAARRGRRKAALSRLKKLQGIPEKVFQVISDDRLTAFSKDLAEKSAPSKAALVLDALDTIGTGYEVAAKLEEMSWTAIGTPRDYRNFQAGMLPEDASRHLILINATARARFPEAFGLMKTLRKKGFPFAVVTYASRELTDAKRLAGGMVARLPKVDDTLQPLIDLVFYYRFAFHYGLAHGRNAEDFPRNRVKSVTAARSSPWLSWSAAREVLYLKDRNRVTPSTQRKSNAGDGESAWERRAGFDWEKKSYRGLRRLSSLLDEEDALTGMMTISGGDGAPLAERLSNIIANEGEILIFPLDRMALAAGRSAVSNLRRILGCSLRVVSPDYVPVVRSRNALLIIAASKKPDERILSKLLQKTAGPHLWIGPELTDPPRQVFLHSAGACRIKKAFRSIPADVLYCGLLLCFLRAWEMTAPEKAATLVEHIRKTAAVIDILLRKTAIKNELTGALKANSGYASAFFLGPPVGAGLYWEETFNRAGGLILESHLYGESVHGPIVTVDGRVDDKFVRLENTKRMISAHGKRKVSQWEKRFFEDTGIDAFLRHPMRDLGRIGPKPFYAEGHWYLPVLQKDYHAGDDNLIIIDATSERYFEGALDELATFGCRYARLMVLTQAAFRQDPDKKVLYQYPVSHLIELPALRGKNGEAIPVSDFLLPLVINALGVAAASATATFG
jgi:glucosamine 6-phosphate synthetase-like amidotransferase/phosphosugar isomerase protein